MFMVEIPHNNSDGKYPIPSEFSIGVAARTWCEPTTSKITMIPELATEFARIIEKYRQALI